MTTRRSSDLTVVIVGAKCVYIVRVCIGMGNIHVWISVYQVVCLRENLLGVDRTCLFEFQCIPIHIFRGPGGYIF